MKNRKINFIKLGILLFGVSLLLFNCNHEELEILSKTENLKKKLTFKTVSVNDAKTIFEERTNSSSIFSRSDNDSFEIDPQWETTQQDSLSFTEELLTNTETIINREGEYNSKVFFIQVNDSIVSAIKTMYVTEEDENGGIKSGHLFFNDFEGKFLDAYKVTEGEVSHRLVISTETQQASFTSLFLFLFQEDNDDEEEGFWCDNGLGGDLDEVVVNSNPTISYEDPGAQDPSFTANNQAIHGFLNNGGFSDVAGGGGNNNTNDDSNSSNNCPSDREWNNATQACDCKGENKVENPITGNCIDNPCINNDQLYYNTQTGKCDCVDRGKIYINGNCVTATPCIRIKKQINDDLQYILKKDYLEGRTNLKEETGFAQNNDGTFTNALSVVNGGHTLTLGNINLADITGFIHTHLNNFPTGKIIDGKEEINQIHRIFSPADVITFLKITKASTNPSNVYATVITSSGDYTLRFTGNINDITGLKTASEYKVDYVNKMKKGRERGFLHFLKDHININGIQLYKQHKPLFSNTIKIQHKTLKSNGKVKTDNCE